jgi:hypothetical protein
VVSPKPQAAKVDPLSATFTRRCSFGGRVVTHPTTLHPNPPVAAPQLHLDVNYLLCASRGAQRRDVDMLNHPSQPNAMSNCALEGIEMYRVAVLPVDHLSTRCFRRRHDIELAPTFRNARGSLLDIVSSAVS